MNSSLITHSNPASNSPNSWQLLVLSAKTESELETATDNLAEFFQQNSEINFIDLAYTLQVDCQAFNHRRILVCSHHQDAIHALTTRDTKRVFTSSIQETENWSVTFMFPGLGEQYINMALQLYKLEPTFRQHIAHCAELIKPDSGFDLRDILYPDEEQTGQAQSSNPVSVMSSQKLDLRRMLGRDWASVDINTQKLNQTDIAQPTLFVVEYALAQMWIAWGIQPQALIGYSLGEYTAATLAGSILEEALALVVKRGQLIQQLPSGAMLAVSLSEMELQPLLTEKLCLSAINGTELCVVAGSIESVTELEQYLLTNGIACRQLQTTHAFHSPIMEAIVKPFIKLVETFDLKPPKIPYISNVTGTWITAEEATDPSYWARHLCQTVRFADGVETLSQLAHQVLLEVGPGQTLGSIVLQHSTKINVLDRLVISSLPNSYNQQSDQAFVLNTLGQLWLTGVPVDWSKLHENQQRCKLFLPNYFCGYEPNRVESQIEQLEVSVKELASSDLELQKQESIQIAQKQRQRLNLRNSYVAPRDDMEQKMINIWQKVFKINQIGIHDNFFSLGGNSLVGTQIITQLRKIYKIDISLSILFQNPTVAELSSVLEQHGYNIVVEHG